MQLKMKILKITVLFSFFCLVCAQKNTHKSHKKEKLIGSTAETLQEEVKELSKELNKEQEAENKEELKELEELVTEAGAVLAEEEKELKKEIAEEEAKEKIEEKEAELEEKSGSKDNEESTVPESEEEGASSIIATETSIAKQEAPENTFTVWNSKGKICILAKFHAVFSIAYASEEGEQKAEITVPETGNVKGHCGTDLKPPLLQISWHKHSLTMMFNKTAEDSWIMNSLELSYDTAGALFDKAANAGKKTARSKELKLFETAVGKSYFCPAQEVIILYAGPEQVATARMKNIQLQPYAVEDGKFSQIARCNDVVLDDIPYVQDETVPLAIGLTLGLIVLVLLVGFTVHRAYNAAKADYNTVP